MHLTLPFAPLRAHTPLGISQRTLRLLCGGILLLAMVCLPRAAWAVCWFTSGAATTVTFNAGNITLTPSSTPSSTVPIWTSNTAAPANPPILTCDGNTNGGIINTIAGPPTGSDQTLFPTGIPGISYRLLHPDQNTPLAAYPNYPTDTGTFSVTTNLALYYTGPYLPPNSGTLTGQLSQWKIDICSDPQFSGRRDRYKGCNSTVSPQPVEIFNISANIIIQVPTCNVDPNSVNKIVTLPNVTSAQLAVNQTPGQTPFSLQLINCPTGQEVIINLNTSSPYGGATGVIAPTAGVGYATNVGVQILMADGSTPVTFSDSSSQAIDAGQTTGSNFAINLFARYFRTGTPVTAGTVKGVATYTINYQ